MFLRNVGVYLHVYMTLQPGTKTLTFPPLYLHLYLCVYSVSTADVTQCPMRLKTMIRPTSNKSEELAYFKKP
jgi:hypothetical protein